jgi:hypothetical protein
LRTQQSASSGRRKSLAEEFFIVVEKRHLSMVRRGVRRQWVRKPIHSILDIHYLQRLLFVFGTTTTTTTQQGSSSYRKVVSFSLYQNSQLKRNGDSNIGFQ